MAAAGAVVVDIERPRAQRGHGDAALAAGAVDVASGLDLKRSRAAHFAGEPGELADDRAGGQIGQDDLAAVALPRHRRGALADQIERNILRAFLGERVAGAQPDDPRAADELGERLGADARREAQRDQVGEGDLVDRLAQLALGAQQDRHGGAIGLDEERRRLGAGGADARLAAAELDRARDIAAHEAEGSACRDDRRPRSPALILSGAFSA